MYKREALRIQENGHLTIGGCDAVKLAQQYQTPLYVMDEQTIRNNCRLYRDSIDQFYEGRGLVLFASKAFSAKEMYRIAMEEGLGADVVSGGELFTALSVNFPVEKIYFHGNNKTRSELEMAVSAGIGHIVVDNLEELELLDQIAGTAGVKQRVMFRIKPGVEAHTHEFIKTGHIDCKFGVALEMAKLLISPKKLRERTIWNCGEFIATLALRFLMKNPFCWRRSG